MSSCEVFAPLIPFDGERRRSGSAKTTQSASKEKAMKAVRTAAVWTTILLQGEGSHRL
jgi:hypothetical protein